MKPMRLRTAGPPAAGAEECPGQCYSLQWSGVACSRVSECQRQCWGLGWAWLGLAGQATRRTLHHSWRESRHEIEVMRLAAGRPGARELHCRQAGARSAPAESICLLIVQLMFGGKSSNVLQVTFKELNQLGRRPALHSI